MTTKRKTSIVSIPVFGSSNADPPIGELRLNGDVAAKIANHFLRLKSLPWALTLNPSIRQVSHEKAEIVELTMSYMEQSKHINQDDDKVLDWLDEVISIEERDRMITEIKQLIDLRKIR